MNTKLTNTIVEHIFDGLGITAKQAIPITSDVFLTEHKISYEDEAFDMPVEAKVWSCATTINNAKITLAYTRFPLNYESKQHVLVVDIQDCPIYGCHLVFDDQYDTYEDGLIAFSIRPKQKSDEKAWLEATNYIQATFLAGMEQLKDLAAPFSKPKESDDIFKSLVSFVKHCDEIQEME